MSLSDAGSKMVSLPRAGSKVGGEEVVILDTRRVLGFLTGRRWRVIEGCPASCTSPEGISGLRGRFKDAIPAGAGSCLRVKDG